MNQLPIIQLDIRFMQEQVKHALMLRQQEISSYVEQGVDRALANIGEKIVQQAADEAAQQVRAVIHDYFAWGPGGQAIRTAVERALEPIAAALGAAHE